MHACAVKFKLSGTVSMYVATYVQHHNHHVATVYITYVP